MVMMGSWETKCCTKAEVAGSIPAVFFFMFNRKKRLRESKKARAFSNSPRAVMVEQKCWNLKCPRSTPACASCIFRFVLDSKD